MKSFKFFFALSLGVVLFLFFARFVIVALIIAAVLSGGFFIARKLKHLFTRDHHGHGHRHQDIQQPVWKDGLLVDYPPPVKDVLVQYRRIEVK